MSQYERKQHLDPLTQAPLCPVCRQSDQVKTMQAAYLKGNVALRTPPSTQKKAWLWPWVIVGLVVIVCAAIQFFLFVQTGGPAGFQGWPLALQIAEVAGAAIVLIVAAGLSLLAFRQLASTNEETVWQYPTDEQQSKRLSQIYHCDRDNVVFDADQQKVLSARELHTFLNGTVAT